VGAVSFACVAGCGKSDASGVAPTQVTSAPAAITEPVSAPGFKAGTYAVYGVKSDDVLNVRAEPDASSKKVYSFGPTVKGVRTTGRSLVRGDTPWAEVVFEGGTGWVNRLFLTEVMPGGGCNDPNLTAAIRKLMRVVESTDPAGLRDVVSPLRGLSVRGDVASQPVHFAWDGVDGVFTSPVAITVKGASEKCGKVVLGAGANGGWPAEYAAVTPVSFDYPGTTGADWYTWIAGFEYVDDRPYVAALIRYQRGSAP
jgi:hypothetical protein